VPDPVRYCRPVPRRRAAIRKLLPLAVVSQTSLAGRHILILAIERVAKIARRALRLMSGVEIVSVHLFSPSNLSRALIVDPFGVAPIRNGRDATASYILSIMFLCICTTGTICPAVALR
jgi:hypothetical protein